MDHDCRDCVFFYPSDDPREAGYCAAGPAPKVAREVCEKLSTVSKATKEAKSDLIGLAQRLNVS